MSESKWRVPYWRWLSEQEFNRANNFREEYFSSWNTIYDDNKDMFYFQTSQLDSKVGSYKNAVD